MKTKFVEEILDILAFRSIVKRKFEEIYLDNNVRAGGIILNHMQSDREYILDQIESFCGDINNLEPIALQAENYVKKLVGMAEKENE